MQPRISLITLGVNDLTQSTRFYQQLGLPRFDFESDAVAFFELQGSWLAFYPKTNLAEDAGVEFGQAEQSPLTLAHNLSSREATPAISGIRMGFSGKLPMCPIPGETCLAASPFLTR